MQLIFCSLALSDVKRFFHSSKLCFLNFSRAYIFHAAFECWKKIHTSVLWLQAIFGGGSGAFLTRQVRLMVLPLLTKRSGAPTIMVSGSATEKKKWERKKNYNNNNRNNHNNNVSRMHTNRILHVYSSGEHEKYFMRDVFFIIIIFFSFLAIFLCLLFCLFVFSTRRDF